MSTGDVPEIDGGLPRSAAVRRIRKQFGLTQAQLAAAMGTSTKAIQSYEQGWRNVPTRVLIQLLVLLAIHRRREVDKVPCWEIKRCPPEEREKCASYTIGDGQLCWFVTAGGGGCGLHPGDLYRDDSLLPCIGCEVVQRLLRNAIPDRAALPAAPPTDRKRGAAGDEKPEVKGRSRGRPPRRDRT